jgi:hypothetical protein
MPNDLLEALQAQAVAAGLETVPVGQALHLLLPSVSA